MFDLSLRSVRLTSAVSALVLLTASSLFAAHKPGESYTERNVEKIAFPIGGTGAGNFFLEGNGSFSGISVRHALDFFNEPTLFAAVCVQGKSPEQNVARVLEGPVPEYKYFSRPGAALGSGDKTYGLPRFAQCQFTGAFPFCTIDLQDDATPLKVRIVGFSPFVPNEPNLSGIPAGAVEYELTNVSNDELELVFSVNARNFMGGSSFEKVDGGFNVVGPDAKFALVLKDDKADVKVDCCWYRGGWFDPLSIQWRNIEQGAAIDNPASGAENAPGASLYLPIKLAANETRTIRLLTAWFAPRSDLSAIGGRSDAAKRLSDAPAAGTAPKQQNVSGYQGHGLVNTFYPDGDAHVGEIVSPAFVVDKKRLVFKVGGGSLEDVGVALQIKEKDAFTTKKIFRGKDAEKLEWVSCDLEEWTGQEARICVFDRNSGPWGHINADSFLLTDLDAAPETLDFSDVVVLNDFENGYGDWQVVQTLVEEGPTDDANYEKSYRPWYATRFNSVEEVLSFFDSHYDELAARSHKFAETLKGATLPPEVVEAVEANLAILKTPTILRQYDGRLWAWEGCQDSAGSCPGSCTHVWNYGQSLPHLFPSLERTFRETEFNESLMSSGRQAFRANLPIQPGGIEWDAADGQLGTIMRLHRDWRISGSDEFVREYWSKAKRSIDYCIRKWDPEESGLLEEPQHNTYDISYTGTNGHCSSFYLGALAAVCRMGDACGEDVSKYRDILEKGKKRFVDELFNGEYFIQNVVVPGVGGEPEAQSDYYKAIGDVIDAQGGKYQYGNGCLSDGVLGFWIAKVCGIDEDIIDPKYIRSHLLAVYKYNFKPDLSGHANTQRPTYALGKEGGLLLCCWPHNDKPQIPFPYSDEVWTGIEYQVASHLAMFGEYDKALDIVRACRARYDGAKRNPFDEYECGHFYARATASFALLQGFSGARYDAVSQTLYYNDAEESYRIPVFTETGYGTVVYDAGTKTATIEVVEGAIEVERTVANQ